MPGRLPASSRKWLPRKTVTSVHQRRLRASDTPQGQRATKGYESAALAVLKTMDKAADEEIGADRHEQRHHAPANGSPD